MSDNTKMREAFVQACKEYGPTISFGDFECGWDACMAWQAAQSAAVPVVGKPELTAYLIEFGDTPQYVTVMHGYDSKSHGVLLSEYPDKALKFADELSATEYLRHAGLLNSKAKVEQHIFYSAAMPVSATSVAVVGEPDCYDAGLLSDFGGGKC